jgi:hypothetical protein
VTSLIISAPRLCRQDGKAVSRLVSFLLSNDDSLEMIAYRLMEHQVAFLSISCACCVDLGVLAVSLWNSKAKIYFWSLSAATCFSLCFTLGLMIYFLSESTSKAAQWSYIVMCAIGYWLFTPAAFMVMYSR